MIQLQKISRHYPVGFGKNYILKDIDLTINEGEFVSIMGPSGSGKSTLLHILGLLEEPSEGQYLFEGERVDKMNEKKRTQLHRGSIGFVFQAYHLIDELTVYENIETPLLYKNIPASERKSRVADVLDRFNMVAKKDLFPNQLSGGQQQLVGIARAIVAEPRVILADEPTGNLHSDQAKVIMQLFKHLNEQDKITIVQVTHSDVNATYGNRVIQIRDGHIQP
ncbi:ABC-type lipoprotein export system, ATPase component [Chitinophaga ginsengisegetis]|uniref:ABC-type lipoprotein export system, ATPase component n=1 Tax=Chitinophaga ginsengisegetis TaxID=393003 RepID=A0A1T5P6Y4_9BACT|nr:ABC transporter ATP-binding protein [Chitinophaga ginsengisegetis]MDR6566439.1 ABC-type lipoprotein export system ATPase subunit [Chitinophaga ginsengisegetis]MDR6646169.1 ABC-type lipoprotein export system ATPase subunit [Chitinophaga ginsengisegetis]MDR6651239.1 ABC-type lipoprotein export system ATPase subunit [Chitinophaga ginsengisegetis]SKD08029.1 ABC-type lipoprotein export system, ATPase component [Chitinophaga ginsengisegetis]